MRIHALLPLAILLGSPAGAQQPASSAVVEAPAADRIAAAKKLMDVLMPAQRREAMVTQMMAATMQNMIAGMRNSTQFNAMFEGNAEVQPVLERFFAHQQEATTQRLRTSFPGMMDAMTRAYARRFTVPQMGEMQAFFETPTGQIYMDQAATIMSDPDVAAWQRQVMADSMDDLPKQMETLVAEMEALKNKEKSGGN